MKNNLFYFALAVLLLITNQSGAAGLQANVATINITPPLEMKYTLGGYGERMNKPATAVHDPIFAKALVVKKDNTKFAIVTLDILGLPTNVKVDLMKRLSKEGWSAENIMLLPSHSHGSLEMAAINSKNKLNSPQIGIFQPELLEFLLMQLETLIKSADQNYQSVKIGTASQQIEGLNRNRRKDPDVDRDMTVTRVDLENGKPLAVLVNWTAHPTFIGGKDMQVSAEWPGYLQSELQKMIGNNVTTMYYNGAEGDQSPVLDASGDAYTKIQIYGKQVAEKAFGIYKTIKPKVVKIFNFQYQTIVLPEHQAHPSFMKTGGEEYGLNEQTVKVVMNMLAPVKVGISAVRIGNLVIVGVPGEMTAVLGKQVKTNLKNAGAKCVTIGGLANEWISYILDKEQYLHGEGYESSVSFFGPDLGQLMVDKVTQTAKPLVTK
ncbi:MAG TPA: neutral/alkaline non-lysosomal ceramidase N-terminal domain-containing protein [Prolixibacteraceae bacterium]|nr:neutral/alkaline non-lysosomal ceramidase N-terminal domain-containing protein [Prolixibacteraceae bacterium]